MGPRHQIAGGVAVAVTLLFVGAGGPPRLTLQNDGIFIDYPIHRGLALIGAAALVAAGAYRARQALRWTFVAIALAIAGLGASRLSYSLAANGEELRQRSLFGSSGLAWGAISKVDAQAGRIVAWGSGDTPIRIGTARLTAQQRASLERTISRRVYEVSPETPAATPDSTATPASAGDPTPPGGTQDD